MIIRENPRTLPFYYQQQFEFFLHLRSLQPQAQGYVPGEKRMQGFAPGVFNSNVTIHHRHGHLLQVKLTWRFWSITDRFMSPWPWEWAADPRSQPWLSPFEQHGCCNTLFTCHVYYPKDGCWKWNTYSVQIELTQCLRFHLLLSTAFPHAEHVRVFPPDNLYC